MQRHKFNVTPEVFEFHRRMAETESELEQETRFLTLKALVTTKKQESMYSHFLKMIAHFRLYQKTENTMHHRFGNKVFSQICVHLNLSSNEKNELLSHLENNWI